ncbi:hypothetical protein IWQ62_002026 [Dispira parvispora]|uniref:Uncharacterized protein n=1 Tax=Dispira parvispora TaxID=1520584 RepID=A0A9W8AWZ7_9FUNG|nr:hypothetical protein IWQ62_002026 [Dispira parvispora]
MASSDSFDCQLRSSTSSTPPHSPTLCDSSDSELDVDPLALGYAPLGTGPVDSPPQSPTDLDNRTVPPSHSDTPNHTLTRLLQMGTRKIPLPTEFPEKPLSETDADTIRSVMSRFSPASHAIPEWAKHIPEEAWLPTLVTLPHPSPSASSGDPNRSDATTSPGHNPNTSGDDG